MNKSKEIIVGDEPNAPFVAYGDDSCHEDVLVYAFLIIPRSCLVEAEALILKIKEYYNISQEIPLHCRILFNTSARQKNNLEHIKFDNVKQIVTDTIDAMNSVTHLLRYAYWIAPPKFDFNKTITTTFKSIDGSPPPKVPIKYDRKGILGLLMQCCFAVPPDGKKGPPLDKCQIFVSEDYTKINFLGPGRSRADKWYNGVSDIGAPPGCVFKLDPVIVKSNEAVLLQVADIFAYICAHAHSKECKNEFFKEAISQVKYKSGGVLNLEI